MSRRRSGSPRPRRRVQPRHAIRLGLVAVAALWVVLPSSARAADAPTQPAAVGISGQIPAETAGVADAAAFALDGAGTKTRIDYVEAATVDAKQSFVDGTSDFVVSGVPFTADQVQQLSKSGRGVIEAPIQAVGLQLFGFVPPLSIFPNKFLDPDCADCSQSERIPYAGPMRFTSGVLADLVYERNNIWSNPDLAANLDFDHANSFLFPPIRAPRPLVRSDSDATNYYLDAYLAAVAPDVRSQVLAPQPGTTAPAPSETWPMYTTPSRQGMDNEVSQIREGLDPGSSGISEGGAVTAVAPSYVREAVLLNAAKPAELRVPLFTAQIRNSAGEWMDPTPAAITTAIAAGEGTPLTGSAGAPVPGAYPITWVNKLYAPSSGLTADQANGIATFIRWQVGAGRATAADHADGQITPAMVSAALEAADNIVQSNCTAAKGTVYTSVDGAPFAPVGGFGVAGPFKLCDAPSQATATTVTDEQAASDAGPVSDNAPYDSSYATDPGYSEVTPEVASESTDSGSLGTGSASGGASGAAGGGAGAGGATVNGERASVQRRMPFPVPGLSLSPLDRAVTLCLGAGTFVVLRSLYERRRAAA